MKQIILTLLIGSVFLTACAGTPPLTQPTTDSVSKTSTPFPYPSSSPTITVTPLPTIPSFTPTFDVSTIVTVTPEPKAECPTLISYPKNDFDLFELMEDGKYKSAQEAVLGFVSQYGIEVFVNYEKYVRTNPEEEIAFQDFTNDGVPDLALRLTIGLTTLSIFGCENGEYQELLSIPSNGLGYAPILFSTEDNNKNGIPELTILEAYLSQGGHSFVVYEWDGEKFASILSPFIQNNPDSKHLWVEATGEIQYADVDNDLLNELILDSGIPVWETYWSGLPWRNKRTYYKWNGQIYAQRKFEFASPEFRFQAVQDADLAISQQEFDKALSLYQESIVNEELKGYSPGIRDNLREQWDAGFGTDPTPTPYPIVPDEYPKLASYAYYRIMLIQLVQNQESEATTTFNTLQQKFGSDPYGSPYVEMASAFWDAYQSTHKMYSSCAAAIQYAVEHPEILTPLGSNYHGAQAKIYIPEDVCPFR